MMYPAVAQNSSNLLPAWVIDVTGKTVPWASPAAKEHFLAYERDGRVLFDLQPTDIIEDLTLLLESGVEKGAEVYCWRMVDIFGCVHRCYAKVVSLGSHKLGIGVTTEPCSEAKKETRDRVGFSSFQHFDSLCCVVFEPCGRPRYLSSKARRVFGHVGNIRSLFAVASASKSFLERLQSAGRLAQEIRLCTQSGVNWYQIEAHLNPKTGDIHFAAHDIQPIRDSEVAMYRLKNYDELTDLPNRNLLYKQLENAQTTAKKRDREFGILYLDLDGFKVVNDTFGHRVGDQLLKQVADRIKTTIPPRSCLYRLGGDEFVVVLEGVNELAELEDIAHNIHTVGGAPYPMDSMEMLITTSIGIACYPKHGQNIDELLKNADAAMYRAKATGHNTCRVYHESMSEGYNAYLTLGGGLRKAIEEEQFELFYQPKIRLSDEITVGAEALIRWRHPELGMIPPSQFIPIAEESGLILPLGEWVIRTACRQLATWRDLGYPPISLSVNLSGRQFMQPDLVERVRAILTETGVDPKYLELELTESMLMADAQETIEKLHGFREIGLNLSIDDFGTGYSSLAYLKKFPIQALKIDRSFVNDLGSGTDDDAIVKATIAMASSLNLKVIAEGVEHQHQTDMLLDYNCQEVQGFLYAKPMDNVDFLAYLNNQGIHPEASTPLH